MTAIAGRARPPRGARTSAGGAAGTAAATARPLMVLLDLIGRRWVLRVLWELRDGALAFGVLRGAAGGLSQSVLTLRLRELKQAGLVETAASGGYQLTADGKALVVEMSRLDRWAEGWATRHGHARARPGSSA